jgi:hypothetical protein
MLNKNLKAWLIKNMGLGEDADDETLRLTLASAMSSGKLTGQEYARILRDDTEDDDPENRVKSIVTTAVRDAMGGGSGGSITGTRLYGVSGNGIRVRGEQEKYSAERLKLKHLKTGAEVMLNNRPAYGMSEVDEAMAGVFFRARCLSQGIACRPLSEHEKSLLTEMVNESTWSGEYGGEWHEGVNLRGLKLDTKALLDDITSGGNYLIPAAFDAAIITTPLLTGELFPFVDVRETNRDRVEGASVGNPTVTWGTAATLSRTAL